MQTSILPAALSLAIVFAACPIRAEDSPTAAPVASERAPSESELRLAAAVRERRVITFLYDGHERAVEPHACGVGVNGEPVLHGYQFAGGSASGSPPGWRNFSVAKITDLAVGERRFAAPRPGYAKSRPRLAPAWAELPVPADTPAK